MLGAQIQESFPDNYPGHPPGLTNFLYLFAPGGGSNQAKTPPTVPKPPQAQATKTCEKLGYLSLGLVSAGFLLEKGAAATEVFSAGTLTPVAAGLAGVGAAAQVLGSIAALGAVGCYFLTQ